MKQGEVEVFMKNEVMKERRRYECKEKYKCL